MPDLMDEDVAQIEQLKTDAPQPQQTEPAKVEPQPQPDQQTEPDQDDTVELENKGKFVRHGAFHAEREQRKQWQERAKELEARYASDMTKANERLATLFANAQKTLQQPEQQQRPPEIPSLDQDPIGHILARIEQADKKASKVDEFEKQTVQQREQSEKLTKIATIVRDDEARFRSTTPDYDNAYNYMQERWRAEATAIGYDPEQAVASRIQETIQLAARMNKSPAEIAYTRSKALGYVPGQTAPASGQQQPAPKTGPTLEQLQAGLKHATNPASAPAPSGTPTIEALLKMDDEEFFSKFASSDEKWRQSYSRI